MTSFWEDKWLGNSSLNEHFVGIYALDLQQEKPVDEAWSPQEFKGTQQSADRLWWKEDNIGLFRVSLTYKLLNQDSQPMINWLWKHIWKVKVPIKVTCVSTGCYPKNSSSIPKLKDNNMLWKIFISLRGIAWTMPRKIIEVLFSLEEVR
ncbi:hypothetical protein H5410_055432 [Solanum commersonii]|uniref:Uncharacterized protein n=1 Tax=Solanum commersonii TaxID=4109 RepID=A0A9J5WI94_SOLCO|nr:hypothetical protein H5410_055432 [Solanum commersonii]